MAILLISTVGPMPEWLAALKAAFPDEEVRGMPEIGDPAEIEIALVAMQGALTLAKLPNLKLIVALRAGVEDLVSAPEIDPRIPICRAQEPGGDKMIDEYVLMHVLRHHRELPMFAAAQARREWLNRPVKFAEERSVGFMGLGVIALSAARRVRDLGFKTAAWTRTPKAEPGIRSFHGRDQLAPFLRQTEILVNVLAVTPETRNICNAETFALLPKGAGFINIGRGETVDDDALIAALDSGQLSHATLDVYRTEPLPAAHPFWAHPGITLMPHTSRRPRAARIIPHAVENIRRFRAGQPLLQPVDRQRGY